MGGFCAKSRLLICPPKQLFAEVAIAAMVMAILNILHYTASPVHQGFFCNDDSIRLPYRPFTVKPDLLLGVTFAGTLLVMLLTELPHVVRDMRPGAPNNNRNERQPCGKCSVGRVVRAFGAYAYGYILVTLITVVLKLSTGQLRPHFLAVCKPDVDLSNCTGYIESYQCTNENATARELKSARESFPSGHASMMFYCATFLVLYLETRIHVVNTRLPKLTLQAGMVTAALYVSVTRITDHHHHRTDVIVGALLGIIVAIVTFTQVARHWINDHKAAEADRDSQNCNNSSTDIDTESADPTTPTPLLSRNGLGEKAGSSGALLGPLRLHIP